jgi:hypothetical protein
MNRTESEALFMAEIIKIDAHKRAGLPPGHVFAAQVTAAVERWRRDIEAECCAAHTVDNL